MIRPTPRHAIANHASAAHMAAPGALQPYGANWQPCGSHFSLEQIDSIGKKIRLQVGFDYWQKGRKVGIDFSAAAEAGSASVAVTVEPHAVHGASRTSDEDAPQSFYAFTLADVPGVISSKRGVAHFDSFTFVVTTTSPVSASKLISYCGDIDTHPKTSSVALTSHEPQHTNPTQPPPPLPNTPVHSSPPPLQSPYLPSPSPLAPPPPRPCPPPPRPQHPPPSPLPLAPRPSLPPPISPYAQVLLAEWRPHVLIAANAVSLLVILGLCGCLLRNLCCPRKVVVRQSREDRLMRFAAAAGPAYTMPHRAVHSRVSDRGFE
eukprot:2010137-Pleurochrysis_carterae.AAC.1